MAELRAKTIALDVVVRFDKAKWSVDQDTGLIEFDRRGFHATAPAQIIGTYNTADSTWLWGWDHPSIEEPLRRDAKVLLAYGHTQKVAALTTRRVSCTENDCWEFTALAMRLCNAQGAYRGPAGRTLIFLTFGELRLSKG